MNKIRCSSLPRVMSCPASLIVPRVMINSSDDVAEIGSAVHEVLSNIVTTGSDSVPDLASYIKKYDLDEAGQKDLKFLAWRGLSIWNTFKTQIDPETISCEAELTAGISDEWLLSGHVDVSGRLAGRDTFVVVDWKAGYVERQYAPQLMGYAYLLFHRVSAWSLGGSISPLSFKIVTAWLRDGSWDVKDVSENDIADFRNRLVKLIESPDKAYSPDDGNCLYCPRSSECPAKTQMVRSAADAFYPLQEKSSAALTPRERLASVYEQSLLLGRALENYKKALKTTVASDGPLSLPDGRVLTLESQERETILFGPEILDVAAPYLALREPSPKALVEEVGREAFTIRRKDLLDAVSRHAERGQKSAAIKSFMAEIAEAGCVKTSVSEMLEAVNPITAKEK